MISDKDEGDINPPRVNAPTMESLSRQDMIATEASLAADNESKSDAEGEIAAGQASEGLPAQQPLSEPVPQRVIRKSRIPRPIPGFISSVRVTKSAAAREPVTLIENIGNRRVNPARIAPQRSMIRRPRTVEEPNLSWSNRRLIWASSLAFSSRYFRPDPLRRYVPDVPNEKEIMSLNILRNYAAASTSPPKWSHTQTVDIGSSTGMVASVSEEVRDNVDQAQEKEIDDISKAMQQAKETSSSSDEDKDFYSTISSEEAFDDAETGDLL